jgi:phosphoribosylformimino-5-aminoimidazole carboxamide ribotide isomerase
MKIIPVIDILDGIVVHAKGGQRNYYQPIKSPLFSSFRPLEVINKLEKLEFSTIYIADLDSIMTKSINFKLFDQFQSKANIELIVDIGVTKKAEILYLFKRNIKKVIIGTETLSSIDFLKNSIKNFGNDRVILSLDLVNKKIINKINLKNDWKPIAFLKSLENFGLSQVIILDLDRVGSERGIDINFIKKILAEVKMKVFIGGGIRNISDLILLDQLGVHGALIGTALYSKKITVSDLKKNKFLD